MRQRGFTLVELLIAIAVFAVMAAIAYGGLSSVIASRDSVNAALDRSKHLQMGLWRIQQDIEQTVDRPVRDQFGDAEPAVMGSPSTGLSVTRAGWPNPLGETRSTLQRVHYQIDGQGHLVRRYFRVTDQAQDSVPVATDLLEGVTGVEWRYLDAQGQWQPRWPPDGANRAAIERPAGAGGDNGQDNDPNYDQGNANSNRGEPLPVAIELRLDTRTWGHLRLLFMIPGSRL